VQGVSVEQFEVASLFCGRFAGFVSEHGDRACVRFCSQAEKVDDEEIERLVEDRQRGWRDNNGQRAFATVMTGTDCYDNHKTTRQRVDRISLIWRLLSSFVLHLPVFLL
jgi:hypothetical protein